MSDPDPARWVVMYGGVVLLSLLVMRRRRLPSYLLIVALLSMVWAFAIVMRGPGVSEYGHMFDAWEMQSVSVEEAREASGLFLVALWMVVLYFRARRTASVADAIR